MIRVAKSAGFCFGVSRALDFVDKGIKEGKKIATLGPIIHNERVVEALSKKGVRIIEDTTEQLNNETVVIRSHGVPKDIAEGITGDFIDATCPFVKKIQTIVEKYHA